MPVQPMDEPFALPASESDVTDGMVFESLDDTVSELAPALQAYRAGELEEAKRRLLHYFYQRQSPRWIFDNRGTSAPLPTNANRFIFGDSLTSDEAYDKNIMDHAGELLQHRFPGVVPFDLGEQLNRFPFYDARQGEQLGDLHKAQRVTASRFARMDFLMTLAVAYHRTGDKRYGETFGKLLDAYVNKYMKLHPYVPEIGKDKEAYWFHFQKTPIRTNLCVARSVLVLIGLMHTELFYGPHVTPQLAFRAFRLLWYLMMYHRSYEANRYRPFNHHLYERGVLPFAIGTMFPEFPMLRELQERGKRIIREHVELDFHASGGYDEHSLHYTCDTTVSLMLTASCALAARNGIELYGEDAGRAVRRTFAFYSALVLPDGTFPDIGDAGGGEARLFLRYGKDWFGSREAEAVLEALDASGDVRLPEHLPPLHVNDPLSGYAAGRDGWHRDSNGFVFSNKSFTRHCGHNHLDMLSLTVWANGETFIGEPLAHRLYKFVGNDTAYNDTLRGTGGHSTVQLCGRPLSKKELFANGRSKAQHVETASFETEGSQVYIRAYHEAAADWRHTRELLFVHRTGFLIADTAEGTEPCGDAHLQRWQLERGVEAEQLDRTALLLKGKQGFLLCVWPDRADLSLKLFKDEAVRDIEQVNIAIEELPWVLDVAFGAERRSSRLPCAFVPLARREGAPVDRCRALLERWSEKPQSDWSKEGEALYSALHG